MIEVVSRHGSAPAPGLRRALFFSFGFLLLATTARGQLPATSTVANPKVTFSTPGVKQVSLQVCNAGGCTTKTREVVVLDPRPQITGAAFPTIVGTNQVIPLTASATGRPPLVFRWVFSSGFDTSVFGNPASWTVPAVPGTYQAHLEVTNADGSVSTTPVPVEVVVSSFTDVPPTYWAWRFVENLFIRGVSTTCGTLPLMYCPDQPMTRAEMAIFLLRAKEGPAYLPPDCVTSAFADVPCSDLHAAWINELVRRGVTAGCGNGNYCPDSPVTREQMAVFLIITKQGPGYDPDRTCTTASFTDMPCSSPFSPWVKELVSLGVTAGCGGGQYCGATAVTRAQMAVFISVMFNLPPP